MATLLDLLAGNQTGGMPAQAAQPQNVGSDISNLSGRIQELLGAKDPVNTGMAGNALSGRFDTGYGDYAQGVIQSAMGQPTLGPQVATQRMSGLVNSLAQIERMQMLQVALGNMNENMRHNRATEGLNTNAQPITTAPTTMAPSFNAPSAPMSDANADKMNTLYGTGGLNSPQGGEVPLGNAPQEGQPVPQGLTIQPMSETIRVPAGQPQLQPLYKGNEPYKDGLQPGFQWTKAPDGTMRAMQIPGTIEKGDSGVVLQSDTSGNITQQVPRNPQAQAKLEANLQQIAQKFDELHQIGGTVEDDTSQNPVHNFLNFIGNKDTQLAATKGLKLPEWLGGETIPAGQSTLQGTQAQTIRGQIQDLVKQTTPIYMQAMGITPGMERAVSAQQMLQDALGGAVGNSRQQNLYSLANLSKQAGTGELYQRLQGQQNQPQAQGHPLDGTVATNAQGQTLVLKNGQWTPQ